MYILVTHSIGRFKLYTLSIIKLSNIVVKLRLTFFKKISTSVSPTNLSLPVKSKHSIYTHDRIDWIGTRVYTPISSVSCFRGGI